MGNERDEALRYAQTASEWGVVRGAIVLVICSILIVVFLFRKEYLYILPLVVLLVLAIYVMDRQSKRAEVYSEESARVASEKEAKPNE